MAGITIEQAEARLQDYLNAEARVLAGQTVMVAGRSLTLANLAEIQRGIDIWNQRVQVASHSATGRSRAINVAPGF